MLSGLINRLANGTQEGQAIVQEVAEFRALKVEINKARCVIEFDGNGNISSINENVTKALGFGNDLVGQHHRALLSRVKSTSVEYQDFWPNLAKGESQTGVFELQNNQGKPAFMQGYYAPVVMKGKLVKVVAYLTDITKDKLRSVELEAEDQGVNSLFGVLELSTDTEILYMNDVLLIELGYKKEEVIGRKLGMMMTEEDKKNPDYIKKWENLKAGITQTLQVKRIAKSGKELWFQASYFPIVNDKGETTKIKAFLSSVTDEKSKSANYEGQIEAISKIQAVIEFDVKGNILAANENFLKATGYSEKEVVGNHHSMFVDAQYKNSIDKKEKKDKA